MKRFIATACGGLLLVVLVGLLSGCDGGGVYDIVNGSLQLAFGIVDVAT
ncbi:MAG: hypothetical protein GY842_06795 [bacterium]|nr:hypothetical protein [bacterium]